MTRTPQSISTSIAELCWNICPGVEPVFLAIRPDPDCEPLDCFACVRRKVKREAGRIQFGWTIWEWPRVYVEAEHHAVYEPPNGAPWVDITPSAFPEIVHRLFLPDDSQVYDFENEGVLRDNVRLALSNDPLIKQFFETASQRVRLLNSVPGVGIISVDPHTARQLDAVENEHRRLLHALGMKYTPQNARCFCGSGEKFKRCHGTNRGRQ